MLDKKAFFIWLEFLNLGSCFFLINSDNQELIYHIHCFEYILCHKNSTMKF